MATRAGRPASQHKIPPAVTAIAALGAGFLLVHLFTRSNAAATTEKPGGAPLKGEAAPGTAYQGTIQEILGEGGSFLTDKLGLGAQPTSGIEGT